MWHERTGQYVHEPDKGSLRGRVVGAYDASGKGGYRGDSPHPRSRVPGATLLESNKAVLRLVFITCSQSSTVISSRSCWGGASALLSDRNRRPRAFRGQYEYAFDKAGMNVFVVIQGLNKGKNQRVCRVYSR